MNNLGQEIDIEDLILLISPFILFEVVDSVMSYGEFKFLVMAAQFKMQCISGTFENDVMSDEESASLCSSCKFSASSISSIGEPSNISELLNEFVEDQDITKKQPKDQEKIADCKVHEPQNLTATLSKKRKLNGLQCGDLLIPDSKRIRADKILIADVENHENRDVGHNIVNRRRNISNISNRLLKLSANIDELRRMIIDGNLTKPGNSIN